MDVQDIALLVEFSEARAYRSLMHAAPQPFLDSHGLRTVMVGSAVAVVAESITNTLNMNRVIGFGIAETATESMVDRIVEIYSQHEIPFGIELGPHARPTDIAGWLQKRRIRRGTATAVHYRDSGLIEAMDSPVSVIPATPEQGDLVAEICCSVFRMPTVAGNVIAATAGLPEWRQWLAYLGDQPIAAALSFRCKEVGWLGWDATLPEFRGRGAQSVLIAHRVNEAFKAGCKYVTTETGVNMVERPDPSFRNYERLGFSLAYERATYIAVRSAKKKPSEQI